MPNKEADTNLEFVKIDPEKRINEFRSDIISKSLHEFNIYIEEINQYIVITKYCIVLCFMCYHFMLSLACVLTTHDRVPNHTFGQVVAFATGPLVVLPFLVFLFFYTVLHVTIKMKREKFQPLLRFDGWIIRVIYSSYRFKRIKRITRGMIDNIFENAIVLASKRDLSFLESENELKFVVSLTLGYILSSELVENGLLL